VLEAASIDCERGGRVLFRGLSFTLRPGELLRIAGANGQGKTSLLRILCGLSLPEQGEVCWRGQAIGALREEFWRQLVYIGHAPALKDDLTATENLRIACTLAGNAVDDAQALRALAELGLQGCERLPARSLSQGQRRRAGLARLALSGRAPLWILDEPFTALDVAAVDTVRGVLERHLSGGAMVIYTTHQDVAVRAGTSRRIELN
jgi:heme exporter protein A